MHPGQLFPLALGGLLLVGTLAAPLQASQKKEDSAGFPERRSRQLQAEALSADGLSPAERAEKARALRELELQRQLRKARERLAQNLPISESQHRLLDEHAVRSVQPKGAQVDEGGPDAFGNTWIMTGDEGGPEYFWVDLPLEDRITIPFPGGNDSFDGPFELPQPLSFYGETYTQFYVSAKGYIGFNSENMQSWINGPIPDGFAPNAQIYAYWDDFAPLSGGEHYYGTDEEGRLVVSWEGLNTFPAGPANVTVQIVVDFEQEAVFVNHDSFSNGMDPNSCTVGIENGDGSIGLEVLSDGAPFAPQEQTTIRFDLSPPPDYACAVDPTEIFLNTVPAAVLADSFLVYNTGLLAESFSLSVENGLIPYTLLHDGSPVANTGVMQPDESFLVHLSATVPGDHPTTVDEAIVTVASDSGEFSLGLPVQASVFNPEGGGPDAFGNTWISSLGGDLDYGWIEIQEEVREVLELGDDEVAGPLELGGLVNFYGTLYDEIYVGSNGLVGFDEVSMTSFFNMGIPLEGTPNNLIALFWDDLDPTLGGQVYTGTDDDGIFVVTWDGVSALGGAGSLTAQVAFDFENQQIRLNYAAFEEGLDVASCTVGIENSDGSDGLGVLFNGDPGVPQPEWTIQFDLAQSGFGVDLPTSLALTGAADGVFEHFFELTNTGQSEESFDLQITDQGQLLEYAIIDDEGNEISSIGPIASFESATIGLRMTVPEDPPVLEEFFSLSACSQQDGEICDLMEVASRIIPVAGSDTWGNTWTSSLAENGPEYFWVDLPEEDRVPITFPNGNDSFDGPFDLPETLVFYDGAYTQFYVSAKGFLGFIPDNMQTWTNTEIPTTFAPNAQIYVFWDDFAPQSGGQHYYGTDEEGRLVVSWENLNTFPSGPANVTIQAVIDFDNDAIYANYAEFSNDMNLLSCTIGLENEDGTVALPVTFNGEPLVPSDETTIRYALAPPPEFWFALESPNPVYGQAEEVVRGTFTLYNVGEAADSYTLFADNPDGFEVWTEINGTPTTVTPEVAPGGMIEIDLAIEIPEVAPVAQTLSSLLATSNGNTELSRDGNVTTVIQLVQGGPDAYGYYWSTTDADGQVEYNWHTMQNPVVVTLGDDDFDGPFDLGFTWNHYGNEVTQVYIASNGYIGFDPQSMTSLGNQELPAPASPSNLVAFFWDDLNPSQGGTVSYEAAGDLFVVQYEGVPEYFNGPGSLTAQVILDQDEEAIRINYQSLANGIDLGIATIGQEGAGGSQGFSAYYNGSGWTPTDGSAIWFGFNVIGPSGPYAVDVDPDEITGIGINGGTAEYELEVENRGENNSTFELAVEANAWDVSFHDVGNDWAEITQVPELAYDEVFLLGVRHYVPEEPASFTDQALVTVSSTMDASAFAEVNILTSASCNHMHQVTQNLTGNGLFGMQSLSDGEWIDGETVIWMAHGVNRMATLDTEEGEVGEIMVLPGGPDYRGIAVDNRDGSIWLTHEQGLYHVDSEGEEIGDYAIDLLQPSTGRFSTGLAFDADNELLWVMCSHGGFDELVRVDVADASNPVGLSVTAVPWSTPFGSGAAGLDYHEGTDQLVAFNAATGDVECFLDLQNGDLDARGDFCPSGLADGAGLALSEDGLLYISSTTGLAQPVDLYRAPCDLGVDVSPFELPEDFALAVNYPNPFNPSTVIRFALPTAGRVQLDVYNLIGQHQERLVAGMRPAGYHDVRFDGSSLSSGVYFYRLQVSDRDGRPLFSDTRKMMLMK